MPTDRVLLLHNRKAGRATPRPDALVELIEAAGHRVVYRCTNEPGWDEPLDPVPDLVALAGGDGTFAKCCALLRRWPGTPATILPTGTANNVALAAGIGGPLPELVRGWRSARLRPFDLGFAEGPFGAAHFVEGVGLGWSCRGALLAEGEPAAADTREAELARDLGAMRRAAREADPLPLRLQLDEHCLAGSWIMLDVQNTAYVGPNLPIGGDARFDDGLLDVVLVASDERRLLEDWLDARREGGLADPPALPVRRARSVTVQWEGGELRLDGRIWPRSSPRLPVRGGIATPRELRLSVEPRVLSLLVPRAAAGEDA